MALKRADFVYKFAKVKAEDISKEHGDDVNNLIKDAFSFIQQKSDLVKGNFEFTIFNDDGTKILIVAGEGHHKFLATCDSEGKTKIRRFAGLGDLKPGLEPCTSKSMKEVAEDTLFEIQKQLWKKMKSSSDKDHGNSANGLVCMRIAHFLSMPNNETNGTLAKNIEIAFYDSEDRLHIVTAGEGKNKVLGTFDSRGNPVTLLFTGHEYSSAPINNDFIHQCDEINKRSLGQMIIKVCGNEGSTDDENTAKIRGLFQAAITYLEKEKEKVWKNSELTVYDRNYDAWKIRAGHGKKKFVGNLDGYGEMVIINSN